MKIHVLIPYWGFRMFKFKKKHRQVSALGLELIKHYEGCSLKAYVCPSETVTIGYGHTKTAKLGQTITKEKAEQLLREDLAWAEKSVGLLVKIKLEQYQFDALVSFVFNVGANAFKNSTLLRCVNAGEDHNVALQFLRWKYVDGTTLSSNRFSDVIPKMSLANSIPPASTSPSLTFPIACEFGTLSKTITFSEVSPGAMVPKVKELANRLPLV